MAVLLALPGDSFAAGLSTRDLNPVLQPVLIPSLTAFGEDDGWRIDHSLFITNTLQQKSRSDEDLFIDVENYRYEIDIGYREKAWRFALNLPLVASDEGELDSLIENWHDFFGLPQGNRDQFPRDRIRIEYEKDGEVIFSQTGSSSGIGDIALTLGYQPDSGPGYYLGIELPTGSESDFSGNDALDLAAWLEAQAGIDEKMILYGMFGVSFPGDGGQLEGLLADQIWVAQLGLEYRFRPDIVGTLQFDLHSRSFDDSELKAFGNSLQTQLGLGIDRLFGDHRLDLFFSEDILVGSAPDISFGLRVSSEF